MSVSTEAYVPIHIGHQTFQRKWDVEEYIQEQEQIIKWAEGKLKGLAYMTSPKEFYPESDNIPFTLNLEVEEAIQDIKEAELEKFKAILILEHWDEMHHPNGGTYKYGDPKARMWCDCCCPVNDDGSPVHYKTEWDRMVYKNTTGIEIDEDGNPRRSIQESGRSEESDPKPL